jgi:hypothetical protein
VRLDRSYILHLRAIETRILDSRARLRAARRKLQISERWPLFSTAATIIIPRSSLIRNCAFKSPSCRLLGTQTLWLQVVASGRRLPVSLSLASHTLPTYLKLRVAVMSRESRASRPPLFVRFNVVYPFVTSAARLRLGCMDAELQQSPHHQHGTLKLR